MAHQPAMDPLSAATEARSAAVSKLKHLGKTDVDDPDVTAVFRAIGEKVTGLVGMEGHGPLGLEARPGGGPQSAVEAGRQVDGEDTVRRLRPLGGGAVEHPMEAAAEQRIDDEIGLAGRLDLHNRHPGVHRGSTRPPRR